MANSGSPGNPRQKDQMHPDDLRNLFIFFIAAALLYFAYDSFVLKPQTKAMAERAKAEQALAEAEGPKATMEQVAQIRDRAEVIAEGAPARISFDNGEIFGTIDLNGGRIDDVSLHKYYETLEKVNNVSVLSPRGSIGSRAVEYGWIPSEGIKAAPNGQTRWRVAGNQELKPGAPVTLFWQSPEGLRFERRIEIDERYMFTITQRVSNASGRSVTLHPYALLAQRGLPPGYQSMWISHEGPIGFIGEELFNDGYDTLRDDRKADMQASQGWLGFTDKYWLSALIPPQGQNVKYSFNYSGDRKDKENKGLYQADFLGDAVVLASGQTSEVTTHFFAGAKEVLVLKDYENALNIPQFDLAVDFGWFWFMTKPFFYAMHYLGLWVGNMGVAIILLTIILRGMTFPLTNISYKSFAKMKKVAPQVTALREKHGEDKQALQKELIAMYQKEEVNPMSGCFPILLQIPIFFALYKTFFVTIEIRHAPFFGWIEDLSAKDPTSIFNLFGLIPWDPPSFLVVGVWPCLMLLAMYVQKKLNPPPQDPIQRDIANYMPFLFAYIMSTFAAGLVVYWTFSALIGILQQIIIMKRLNVPVHLFGETEEEKALDKALDKGPALHPLAEMAEQEVEEALGLDEDAPKKEVSPPKPKKSKKKKK